MYEKMRFIRECSSLKIYHEKIFRHRVTFNQKVKNETEIDVAWMNEKYTYY